MTWRDFAFAVIGFLIGIAAAIWVLIFVARS
jgi:hypothetical protein